MLRAIGLVCLILSTFGATGARAEVEYPFCLVPSLYTVGTCTYATYEQCAATASGNSGVCTPNPRYVAHAGAAGKRKEMRLRPPN
jgi:hypothetical protein